MGGIKEHIMICVFAVNVFLLLIAALAKQTPASAQTPSAYDTVYIFDYRAANSTYKRGKHPLLLRFQNGDSLQLDAGSRNTESFDFHFNTHEIPQEAPKVEGVRILFLRGSRICIRSTGVERVRKKSLMLDTLLCVDPNTPEPWIYWNPPRQGRSNPFWFKPELIALSNREWAYRLNYVTHRVRELLSRTRYEYNAATGVLTDNRKAKP